MRIDWLTATPVAHRGFHSASDGCLENTLPAILAARQKGFAIEIDVQLSADARVMAFHDFTLDRLTETSGPVASLDAAALTRLRVGTGEATIPTLTQVLDAVNGAVPLFIEIKSRFDAEGEQVLCEQVAAAIERRHGPIAVMSFDPQVVARMRHLASDRPRGIIADGARDDEQPGHLSESERTTPGTLSHWLASEPDFIACAVTELPSWHVTTARRFADVPLLAWTVRTSDHRNIASAHADQIIFEGFEPLLT